MRQNLKGMRPFHFRSTCRLLPLLIALCMMLCGCTFGAAVDTLLTPPRMNGQQAQIYQALQNAVGKEIKLQYPKSGEYLSAFLIVDLDGDSEDEALVFYQKTTLSAAENTLRINVLDQNRNDSSWMSVCDVPAAGSEIEKVIISPLGEMNDIRIIIGYSVVDQSNRALTVYAYRENTLQTCYTDSYAMFDVGDFDGDQRQELLTLRTVTSSADAQASVCKPDENEVYKKDQITLRSSCTGFSQLLYAKQPDGSSIIYADVLTGVTTMQTELLRYDGKRLSHVFQDAADTEKTNRAAGYLTLDIDDDGCPEIPVQTVFPGYEGSAADQNVRLTRWMTVSNERLVEKYRGCYSVSDGYAFMLPDAWKTQVTAINDNLTGDIVFCRYTKDAVLGTTQELLRISTATERDNRESRLTEGYRLVFSRGSAFYFMKVIASEDALCLPESELIGSFMLASNERA